MGGGVDDSVFNKRKIENDCCFDGCYLNKNTQIFIEKYVELWNIDISTLGFDFPNGKPNSNRVVVEIQQLNFLKTLPDHKFNVFIVLS